jgi:hypothetical protein
MTNQQKIARTAGVFYLFNIVLSLLYMEYIPSVITVWDNPEATLKNLLNNETLFRWGILFGIMVHISFILLPLTLYKLLHHINRNVTVLMVVFAIISVPMSFTFLFEQLDIVESLKNYDTLKLTEIKDLQSKVAGLYKSLFNGFFICQVFWGLWLFPFGYLTFKSGFLPKTLGVFLMLGCVTYLIDVVGGTLFKNYYDHINTRILIIPAAIGEIGSCLWLLIIGTKQNVRF